MARKPPPKRRGYDSGGYVDPNEQRLSSNSIGNSIVGGFMKGMGAGKYLADASKDDKKPSPKPDPAKPNDTASNNDVPSRLATPTSDFGSYLAGAGGGNARGGRIKQTMGKRIGKDDGLIPAQRGEYVVRKSAVKKLGTAALNQINRGKIPPRKGR